MDINFFKKQFFTNPFLPHWVGIDACFCFCAALLEGQNDHHDENLSTCSVIDLSKRLETYPAPSSTLLNSQQSEAGSFLTSVDELVRGLLNSGAVRIRARNEFHELDHDYRKFSSVSDFWEDDTGQAWDNNKAIDYQNRRIVLHDSPEEFLDQCIGDYDYYLQTQGFAELVSEVHSAIVDIQVSSADLLHSLDYLIKSLPLPDSSSVVLVDEELVTGNNRFYYSTKLGRWVVEFDGRVSTYKNDIDELDFNRLRYLLKYALTPSGLDHNHLYSSVDKLGYGSNPVDEDMEYKYSDTELHESSYDDIAYEDADSDLDLLKKAEQTRVAYLQKNPDNEAAQTELKQIQERIQKITFGGKPKARTDMSTLRHRVTTSVKRAIEDLDPPPLRNHLRTHIEKGKKHLYYNAKLQWLTDEQI